MKKYQDKKHSCAMGRRTELVAPIKANMITEVGTVQSVLPILEWRHETFPVLHLTDVRKITKYILLVCVSQLNTAGT